VRNKNHINNIKNIKILFKINNKNIYKMVIKKLNNIKSKLIILKIKYNISINVFKILIINLIIKKKIIKKL
jgi:hypothetical protein